MNEQKRPRGRPKNADPSIRPHRVTVSFTRHEMLWLRDQGNLLGRTPSAVARLCVDAAIVGVGTMLIRLAPNE